MKDLIVVGRPRKNPDRLTTPVERSAAYTERLMSLTPHERIARKVNFCTSETDRWTIDGLYTPDEKAKVIQIQHMIAALKTLATELNGELKKRLTAAQAEYEQTLESIYFYHIALEDLEKKTRHDLPNF